MMCRPGATGRDRRDGYLSALADWGMLGKARVVIVDSASARTLDRFPFPQEPGKIERFVHPAGVQAAAAQATLNLAAECDAIISANSSLTLGVRSALVGLADGRPHHVGFSARDTAVAGEDEIVPPRKRVTETILEHIRAIRSGRVSPNSQPIPPSLETISENGSTRSPQRPTLSVRAGERHLPDR